MRQTFPATIGRYQIEGEIGRGAMGIVYLARDPELGRAVALKTVSLSFPASAEEKEAFQARFMAEARAVAALSHPGVVTIHDVGRDPGTASLYIAFELLEGRTLSERVAGGERMDWPEALRVTAAVAEALHHAHKSGIVHRDVKPANIMLLPSGQPKIMDFGVAKLSTEHLTATGQFFGTPSFMSPEQLSGEALDGRSDIFSLGAVLHALLTGRGPFDAATIPATLARVLYHEPPAPSAVVAGLPSAVDSIVAVALSKDRGRRYPDGLSFARAARAAMEGNASRGIFAAPPARSDTRREAMPQVAPLPGRRSRRTWLAAGAALAVAVGFGAILTVRSGLTPLSIVVPAARLEVDFEHPLRTGVLKVWVDDALVLEEPLESRVTEDLVVVKLRAGRERKTLPVAPGERRVRLDVQGDGFTASRSITGTFESAGTRRLNARVGGLLRRELSVWWGS